jgi:hypothetical protein
MPGLDRASIETKTAGQRPAFFIWNSLTFRLSIQERIILALWRGRSALFAATEIGNMGRIKNPKLFSQDFAIDPKKVEGLGLLDPILNGDTKLFIDPVLLKSSKHPIIASRGFPLHLAPPKARSHDELKRIVAEIVDHFKGLVEKNGVNYLLWDGIRNLKSERSALSERTPDIVVVDANRKPSASKR